MEGGRSLYRGWEGEVGREKDRERGWEGGRREKEGGSSFYRGWEGVRVGGRRREEDRRRIRVMERGWQGKVLVTVNTYHHGYS